MATPWRRNRKVVRLTKTIVDLDRKTAATIVRAVIRLGKMLQDVKDQLPHGEWLRWLEEGAHMDVSSARRYLGVFEWSSKKPREFAKVRDLSITKIYRLLDLAPPLRRRLYDRTVPIPDTTKRLALADMTVSHLDRVIRDMTAKPPPTNPVPALLQAARHRLAGFEAQANDLIEHKANVPRKDIVELHEQISTIATRIESAFDL